MKFEIGEVAIGQNCVIDVRVNGMECVITEDVKIRRVIGTTTRIESDRLCYMVKWADGRIGAASPLKLRKKKPPKETSTWEEVQEDTGWNPQKSKISSEVKES